MLRGLTHTPDAMETFGFITRFDSLSAGACLALLFLAAQRGKVSIRMLEVGALAAIPVSALALFLLSWRCGLFSNVELRSTLAFSVCGYTLIAILCAAVVALSVRWSGSSRTRILRQRPLVYLGAISYMMYLIHVPVYVVAGMSLARIGPLPQMAVLQGIVAAVCTIGLAALSWKYFETPILNFKDRKFFRVAQQQISPPEEPLRLRAAAGE
jgi:peptidoglycan/LPS O-acetylase OafA/YrhL